MRNLFISAVASLALGTGTAFALGAEGHEGSIVDVAFSFEGPFGTYDEAQLRRGFQVFNEVCASCHGMKYVPIRSLGDEGGPAIPADQLRDYAATLSIIDKESGEERPRIPADMFPTVVGDGMGPDLSVIAKGRAGFHGPYGLGINQLLKGMGGAEYIYSVLVGYEEAPACAPDDAEGYYNVAFTAGGVPDACKDAKGVSTVAGTWIAMPQMITDDVVTYADGTPASAHQVAEDISAFLMWAAEPKLAARKQAGFIAVLMLTLLSVLLYFSNKQLWAPHKGKKTA
ncbi:MAG: cytochrome c1 [Phaeovulum sp.]|uniref:cytochrome c1 n=1 Tax=Phaeovulum sp. TaxID=2934796 RepID=UPI0027355EBE|nr:cytochrome c1 [Phaeovulum sp.]MDP3862076.1 cytochrome c1 [Phaeovulum sp.]